MKYEVCVDTQKDLESVEFIYLKDAIFTFYDRGKILTIKKSSNIYRAGSEELKELVKCLFICSIL
jgi:hypothetical protein